MHTEPTYFPDTVKPCVSYHVSYFVLTFTLNRDICQNDPTDAKKTHYINNPMLTIKFRVSQTQFPIMFSFLLKNCINP